MRNPSEAIFRLKVTLCGIRPPIWRRFIVPGAITLKHLHDGLQAVMGWTDNHLHLFEAQGVCYGPPGRDIDIPRVNENKTTIHQLLRCPKARLKYGYDFGDGWGHEVVLEEILPAGYGVGPYPIIEAGRRACPPEDVGGIKGYQNFLEAVADSKHPEHRELIEWTGGGFDPEAFDVDKANLAIQAALGRHKV